MALKVGDLVEHKDWQQQVGFSWRPMRGIVLRVRTEEIKVQWFPVDSPAIWLDTDTLKIVSGAVYNSV